MGSFITSGIEKPLKSYNNMKLQILTLTMATAIPESRLRRAGVYRVPTYRWKYNTNVPGYSDSYNSATGKKWTEPSTWGSSWGSTYTPRWKTSRWGSSLFGGDSWGSSWGSSRGSSWNRWG